jgi:hypothetical protein
MHTYYSTYIAFPLQKWLFERATMLRHTHIACLVSIQQNSSPLIVCIITYYALTVRLLASIRQKVHKIIRQHSNGNIMLHSDTTRLGRFKLLIAKHTPLDLRSQFIQRIAYVCKSPSGIIYISAQRLPQDSCPVNMPLTFLLACTVSYLPSAMLAIIQGFSFQN